MLPSATGRHELGERALVGVAVAEDVQQGCWDALLQAAATDCSDVAGTADYVMQLHAMYKVKIPTPKPLRRRPSGLGSARLAVMLPD